MAAIEPKDFFRKKRDASEIKSEILNKYFNTWCGIILYGQKKRLINTVLYIDLYSGPGYYDDGQPSTPIKILDSIFQSIGQRYDLNRAVRTFFNDNDKAIVNKLKLNLENLPYYQALTYKPIVLNKEADFQLLTKLLNNDYPALTFIDPFGYSFSKKMLLHCVQKWGSDLFMLFNLNRIRSAVLNDTVDNLMNNIFGERIHIIREFYKRHRNSTKREDFIIENFEAIFKERGYKTFKFRVNFPNRNQTSHYLFFVSKVDLAYIRMKEIMVKYSDFQEDGIPLFGANLKSYRLLSLDHYRHFQYSMVCLVEDLSKKCRDFHGRTIEDIYVIHNIGTNYIKDNYKCAFEMLREQNIVDILDPKSKLPAKRTTFSAIIKYK